MVDSTFFDETTEQSLVKARIVSKYFYAWAKVVMSAVKKRGGSIMYVDLFAGPGRYKDGTASTPLRILERAIADPDMRDLLVTIFNDRDQKNTHSLQTAIEQLPGVNTLAHRPQVFNHQVGDQIVRIFEHAQLPPTLTFVDPWGYKGLSLKLVDAVLQGWGCDCVFFFNYNRINMGLNNDAVRQHMDALFGEERAMSLRQRLAAMGSASRETAIIEEISQALKALGGKHVLPFCFTNAAGTRTSHYLVFVSKHFRGFEIMRDVMGKESSEAIQGVPSFSYCPASEEQALLFELNRPLDELGAMLLKEFAGTTVTVKHVYERHSVGRRFVKSNYKAALRQLEASGSIVASPPAARRRKGTMADHVRIAFPRQDG